MSLNPPQTTTAKPVCAPQVEQAFLQFVAAVTCKSILSSFQQLLDVTGLRHVDHSNFYARLKEQLKNSWKAQALWAKLDKRAAHRDYGNGKACADTKVLIIGAGPSGLRIAIECALLGARTVLVEKRDRFSRNNVLHLWPYLIPDLKNLGAKMFFGKFCAGAIDHISIRQLQCILLKVALLVGVEVHVNVAFDGLIEPPEDQSTITGWRCICDPKNHPVAEYQFDVLVGADGKRNTLSDSGFTRKEFRGKLAIAITANFINSNSPAEAGVEEISGVAFIFNQKFFLDLKEKTGIDLENIVYYKDDTHYFVMTAKKQSLLEKRVLIKDCADTFALLGRSNVNHEALLSYAREAANFCTNQQLPHLEYAVNHYGQADVAMFDFTSFFAAGNASRVMEKHGRRLLIGLVGDSLLESFWPTGSGCARGFLGAFDMAWMIRSWAGGRMSPLEVIAERESIFTLLSQTTPDRLHKKYHQYSIDPNTRYPNLSTTCVKPRQVVHLYDGVVDPKELEEGPSEVPAKRARNVVSNEDNVDSYNLLCWCQRVLNTGIYRGVHIVDFTSSWRSGLAFCALIHAFKPTLVNVNSLMECETVKNNQLAFDTAQKELGIAPVITGEEMASCAVPDKLTMVAYLSQYYELFKHEPLPSTIPLRPKPKEEKPKTPPSPNSKVSLLSKIGSPINRSKKRTDKEEGEEAQQGSKKLRDGQKGQPVLLAAQHGSEFCYFCEKRVYIMERQGAEGVFFHRDCLKCDYCGVGLRLNNYSCERPLEGGVKFYCYRHFNPESRIRPRRKRNLDAAEDSKENIPTTVTTPAEETEAQLKNGQATPKKHIPAPLQVPDEPLEKASKTPERIEFQISFDGQEEETEEEQYEHNMRRSMSSDTTLDNSDDDEEEDESDESGAGKDSLSAGDSRSLTWDEAVRLASTWKRQHSKEDHLEAVEMEGEKRRDPSRDAYDGRGVEDDDDDDDDDEEGSSTEVEEGDGEEDVKPDEDMMQDYMTAAASDMEHAMLEKHKSPKPHAEDKHKKSKGKHKRTKSKDSLDDNLTSDIKGLKITSVFDKELDQEDGERQHHGINRPIPIAPKASVDEFSDSDESIVSVNTLMRRKDQLTEGLDDRVARKLKRMAGRQAEQQRLRAAQEIQRRLQEVDERQRELEDRGIAVEKALRGDGPEADVEESQLMGEWFNLVHEKNALGRYESELMVKAKELELEDRQERLQSAFRDSSAKPDTKKTPDEIEDEGHLLDELLDVVEQRNSLVAKLEEDRPREQQEDRELENMMVKKGFVLSPLNYARSIPPANLEPPVPPT